MFILCRRGAHFITLDSFFCESFDSLSAISLIMSICIDDYRFEISAKNRDQALNDISFIQILEVIY